MLKDETEEERNAKKALSPLSPLIIIVVVIIIVIVIVVVFVVIIFVVVFGIDKRKECGAILGDGAVAHTFFVELHNHQCNSINGAILVVGGNFKGCGAVMCCSGVVGCRCAAGPVDGGLDSGAIDADGVAVIVLDKLAIDDHIGIAIIEAGGRLRRPGTAPEGRESRRRRNVLFGHVDRYCHDGTIEVCCGRIGVGSAGDNKHTKH